MIIGIGNDMIDIRRVERTIERYGERFLERIFTKSIFYVIKCLRIIYIDWQ